MISAHNVPYALKCINDVFKQHIPRSFGFSQPGNFKEESASGVGKSPAAASIRKCLAGESPAQQIKVWQVVWVDVSGVWIVSLLLSNVVDGAVTGVGMLVDLTVPDTLKSTRTGQTGPKTANSREHIKIAYQAVSSPSCSARKKPRMLSSTSPACGFSVFSLVG